MTSAVGDEGAHLVGGDPGQSAPRLFHHQLLGGQLQPVVPVVRDLVGPQQRRRQLAPSL